MGADIYDGGFNGRRVSLAGSLGAAGRGLKMWSNMPAPPITTGCILISSNPGRLFALFTNEGTVDVQIAFDNTWSNGLHTLRPGGSFQIDDQFPWTGPVYGRGVGATGSIAVEEGLLIE